VNNFFLLALGPILLGCEFAYIRFAKSVGVIDNPNNRSLHEKPTIRGGGIIFPLAIILLYSFSHEVSTPFLVSIVMISVVGILDDMKDLSSLLRFGAQAAVVFLIFYDVGVFAHSWWVIALLLIIAVGTVNAYNFMDGINGITSGYSLVLLMSLLYINSFIVEFVSNELILTMIIALVVFSLFNFRKKALCFAGDVGSLSIGVAVIYLILKLTMVSHNYFSILLLSVYGVDSVLTIIHRLWLRQNIFKAHRLHLYQVVIASTKMPHLRMVFFYMLVQAFIDSLVVILFTGSVQEHTLLAISILGALGFSYIMIKRRHLKSI
jgi:UDP-N-acetylmuramyl pentapeptide phosphotransferase/UDP-N-acetylglucosamine-1-phosphate transferase